MFNSFQFGSGVTSLTKFAVNNIEAAVGIDFVNQQYRLADQPVTFADAFIGSSPDLTYSTSSNSTMVNSAGNIVWAPHNSVPNSEDFRASGPSSPWVHQNSATITENAITAPDDGSNGTQLEFGAANNSQIRNDYGLGSTIHGAFTIRVWVKCATGTTEKVRLKSFSSGNGNQNSDDITVTDQWALVSYSFVKSSGSSMSTYISNATDAVARTIFIWGAHVYRSDLGGMAPVPGAVGDFEYYVPTNGDAEYLPRVGHHVYNGSAWVNEGLLIESEERTNLVAESATLSNWGGLGAQANSGVGSTSLPDGSIGGVSVSRAAPFNMYKTGLSVSESTAYTASIFVKAETAASIKFGLQGTGFRNSGVHTFDILNGSVNTVSNWTATIEPVGNDWWRLSVSSTTSIGATSVTFNLGAVTDNQVFYAWGAQLEEGSFATSYIPTSGSQQTRSADLASIPVTAFGYNDQAGTIVVEYGAYNVGAVAASIVSVTDNPVSNDFVLVYADTSVTIMVVKDNGVRQALFSVSGDRRTTGGIAGIAMKDNAFASTVDGSAPQTDISGTMPTDVSVVRIGSWASNPAYLNGHIKSLKYFPRRLTDAQLQELTA